MLSLELVKEAYRVLEEVINHTPLQFIERLSEKYGAKVYFKREDLQPVRSYKIRGAYFKISNLPEEKRKRGVVCASAGNHAQGVAFACKKHRIKGVIFMPVSTPKQKIKRVEYFGNGFVEIKLAGENYDEAKKEAVKFAKEKNMVFVHPFEDEEVIAGQGTIGLEILEDLEKIDAVFVPIGGGGLISGVSIALKSVLPEVKIIGVEPKGADSMKESLEKGELVELEKLDTFVDGVAVKKVGKLNFELVKKYVDDIIVVPEGQVAQVMIDLYQNEGIITEPAGALSVAGFEKLNGAFKGKTVVCIISGGNNDLLRYPEILERALIWEGRKKYFIIEFYQKPGQLKKFVNEVLGPGDDIVFFEYVKKNNKEKGPALVGIEFEKKEDAPKMIERMKGAGFKFKELTRQDLSYYLLV